MWVESKQHRVCYHVSHVARLCTLVNDLSFTMFDCVSKNTVKLVCSVLLPFCEKYEALVFPFAFSLDHSDELRKEARQLKKELLAIKQRKEERGQPEESSAGND